MELKEIQNLIEFVAKSGASEVSLEMGDIKITIKTDKGGEPCGGTGPDGLITADFRARGRRSDFGAEPSLSSVRIRHHPAEPHSAGTRSEHRSACLGLRDSLIIHAPLLADPTRW